MIVVSFCVGEIILLARVVLKRGLVLTMTTNHMARGSEELPHRLFRHHQGPNCPQAST